ncbi:ATP-grasp domain-containing protein [Bacillus sp. Gen3]|nr:ATP-grasp domain-containing protein [Bacillus sp. Gen3]
MSIKKVLITGGRAYSTIELARLFERYGIEVHIAESLEHCMIKKSKAVSGYHLVASPKTHLALYIEQLITIIEKEGIELLIPTCEEIFFIAKEKERFPLSCKVLTDSFDTLLALHNKYTFIQKAREIGLNVPQTFLIESQEQWNDQLNKLGNESYIAKPVFSRFSSKLWFFPDNKGTSVSVNEKYPWVIQKLIEGKQYCTYSFVQQGNILAHCTYPSIYKVGMGATTVFQYEQVKSIETWVSAFVKKLNFSGQIAFDFIQTKDGEVYPIECNPRLTSGIHLFRGTDIVECFLGRRQELVFPVKNRTMIIYPTWVLSVISFMKIAGVREYFRMLVTSKDVLFDIRDIGPFFYQFRFLLELNKIRRKRGISLVDATTFDISWDGDNG